MPAILPAAAAARRAVVAIKNPDIEFERRHAYGVAFFLVIRFPAGAFEQDLKI